MTLVEIAALVFGTGAGGGLLVHSVAYAARHVPVALATARLENAKARTLEKEGKVIDSETVRDWQEDTGRIYKDQRSDLEKARDKAEIAQKAVQVAVSSHRDCEERLKKIEAACKADQEKNEILLRAQRHEVKNVRAVVELLLASDAAKSIPPADVAAARTMLANDTAKAATDTAKAAAATGDTP